VGVDESGKRSVAAQFERCHSTYDRAHLPDMADPDLVHSCLSHPLRTGPATGYREKIMTDPKDKDTGWDDGWEDSIDEGEGLEEHLLSKDDEAENQRAHRNHQHD
jgi:hypothetical protein